MNRGNRLPKGAPASSAGAKPGEKVRIYSESARPRLRTARLDPPLAALCVILFLPIAVASAEVSCDNPDNLCTGDPCVTPPIEVACPCVADFGARTLVIGGRMEAGPGCVLSLTAAAIEVNRAIDAGHTGSGANGGDVSLSATTAGITVRRAIISSGRLAAGNISLVAAGDIDIEARLKAPSGSHATSAGTITLAAQGRVRVAEKTLLSVKGRGMAPGGNVALRGDAGVELGSRAKVDARGGSGGAIELSSFSGGISTAAQLRAEGKDAQGGVIGIVAAVDPLSFGAITVDEHVSVRGSSDGGVVTISAPRGDISISDGVRADGQRGVGGAVAIGASGYVAIGDRIYARGDSDGGSIAISGASVALSRTRSRLDVDSDIGLGGTVDITASLIDLIGGADIRAPGGLQGGHISLTGGFVSIGDGSKLYAPGKQIGGTVEVNAAGDILYNGDLDVGGDAGGLASLEGATVQIGPDVKFRADGAPGGEIRLAATAGDLSLSGVFDARDGGVIEGQAFCNLTATGVFRVRVPGCIGLAAGPTCTLDTTGASFDLPLSGSCP